MTPLSRLAAILLVGCAAPSLPPPASPEPLVARPLSPMPVGTFDDGPAVADPAALLTWLEADAGPSSERRRVQLPVVVRFDDEYRLGVVGATLGPDVPGALHLKLDDTAMGVALLDHLRRLCPPGPTCAVWLEGTWGPLMAGMPDFGGDAGPKRHDFTVLRVVGLADASAAQVRVERR